MNLRVVLASLLALTIATGTFAQPRSKPVRVVATYKGTVLNKNKPKIKANFIAKRMTWQSVWNKIHPNSKTPLINFKKYILLVTKKDAADPNRGSLTVLKSPKGVLTLRQITTLIGFRASDRTKYTFHKVSRQGVSGVSHYDRKKRKIVVVPLP